jgi:hypothetical protein
VNAIKNIGLWDERFCSIEYQEADYFNRAFIYNKDFSSINDFHHKRVLNPILPAEHDRSFVYRDNTDYTAHEISTKWGSYNLKLLNAKYANNITFGNGQKPVIANYITYPYFEKDIIDLDKKYFY